MLTGPALARFRKNLLAWFKQFQRDLPWRRSRDPYAIWLSEIMLQQTRVAAVIPYFERFLQSFPTIQSLAEAQQQEVLRLWSGLGYYSRARNLQKAARQIVERHSGKFPSDQAEALALSGVGNYTAAAILSIAFGKQLAVLDGNVARVLARLGAVHGDLRAGNRWAQLQATADTLLDPRAPGDWNQALMELGATLCTPRSPQCLLCPVAEFCEALKQGLVDVIPEKRSKPATQEVLLTSAVFLDAQGRTILLPPPKSAKKPAASRNVSALLSNLWHFPTAEVDAGLLAKSATTQTSVSAAALQGFLHDELFLVGKPKRVLVPLDRVRHAVTYRAITLLPFLISVSKLPKLPGAKALPLKDLSSIPISNLTRKIARSAQLGISPKY